VSDHHKIEVWDVEKLIPYEANAKKHPEEQVRKLAVAIQKFGWTQPIVVWQNGEIIAGHGRRLAAIHLGLKRVPVICRRDLTRAEADALRLADNRVASTDYDQTLIQSELQRLSEELASFDIALTDLGFDQKEIDFSIADLGDMDDSLFVDDVAEAVEQQKEQNEHKVQTTDEIAAPVVDALGFKRVSIAESRLIRDAMIKIETRTGKKGAEAFVEFMASL
jgi:ParB-like chromosome segregation protein Spo0J